MLTAWGYSFPTQAPMTDITWQLPAGAQNTTVRFVENGEPMVNLPFDIHRSNGVVLHHQSDENGDKYLGKLSPGTELYIEVPSMSRRLTLTVTGGQEVYTFDLTVAKPRIPEIPEVHEEEAHEEVHEKEDEPEEIICGARTIRVQYIGCDGQPIKGRSIMLSQNGRLTETTTDDSGNIYLNGNDFANDTAIKSHIGDVPQQPGYSDCSFTIEHGEDDYAIVYSERKQSQMWLTALLLLLGACLAFLTIWGALMIDIG